MIARLLSVFKKDASEIEVHQSVHMAEDNSCETRPLEVKNLTKIQGTFSITPSTVERVKKLVLKDGRSNSFLRFSVVSGGCSGYSYDFKIDDTINPNDIVVEQDGVKVVSDENSISLINGSELDYIDDASGSKFEVKNPNASHGCGSSFGV